MSANQFFLPPPPGLFASCAAVLPDLHDGIYEAMEKHLPPTTHIHHSGHRLDPPAHSPILSHSTGSMFDGTDQVHASAQT